MNRTLQTGDRRGDGSEDDDDQNQADERNHQTGDGQPLGSFEHAAEREHQTQNPQDPVLHGHPAENKRQQSEDESRGTQPVGTLGGGLLDNHGLLRTGRFLLFSNVLVFHTLHLKPSAPRQRDNK